MDFELRFAVVHLPGSFALDLLSARRDVLVLRSGVHNSTSGAGGFVGFTHLHKSFGLQVCFLNDPVKQKYVQDEFRGLPVRLVTLPRVEVLFH